MLILFKGYHSQMMRLTHPSRRPFLTVIRCPHPGGGDEPATPNPARPAKNWPRHKHSPWKDGSRAHQPPAPCRSGPRKSQVVNREVLLDKMGNRSHDWNHELEISRYEEGRNPGLPWQAAISRRRTSCDRLLSSAQAPQRALLMAHPGAKKGHYRRSAH